MPSRLIMGRHIEGDCHWYTQKSIGPCAHRLHVDAAYAGVTAMLPEMRGHFSGMELVDSFNTNVHKWLLTNMDCSCLWVADATYVRAALSLLPAYLRGRGNDLDFKVHGYPAHIAKRACHSCLLCH